MKRNTADERWEPLTDGTTRNEDCSELVKPGNPEIKSPSLVALILSITQTL